MNQNIPQFDFSQVGKRTPYRVPEGFFADNEKEILSKLALQPAKQYIPLRRWVGYAAVATVLLVAVVYPLATYRWSEEKPVYSSQEDWSQFADADLFLENMNW